MARSVLRLASDATTSRTTLVDLNNGSPMYLGREERDWGTAGLLRRAEVESALDDGGLAPWSAFGLRTITLPIRVVAATRAAATAAVEPLTRALNRSLSILEWQPVGAASPVFFRVLRSADIDIGDPLDGGGAQLLRLTLRAEPFAIGLKHTPVTALDVNNDAAAGMTVDVTGVLGDVDTPALIQVDDSAAVNMLLTVALRSRGTPSALTHYRQAEAMTRDASATLAAVGGFSGSGNNAVTIAFGTTNDLTTARLTQLDFLGAASVENAGVYRLMARVARTGGAATDDFEVAANLGPVAGRTVAVANLTGPQWVDLGLYGLAWPLLRDGYGAPLPVDADFTFYARRAAGAGSLNVDGFLAMPADTSWCEVDFQGGVGLDSGVLDGPQDAVYRKSSGGGWVSSTVPRVGGLPSLAPGQTNRLYIVRSRTSTDDQIADDCNVTVSYWPRYLHVAP